MGQNSCRELSNQLLFRLILALKLHLQCNFGSKSNRDFINLDLTLILKVLELFDNYFLVNVVVSSLYNLMLSCYTTIEMQLSTVDLEVGKS